MLMNVFRQLELLNENISLLISNVEEFFHETAPSKSESQFIQDLIIHITTKYKAVPALIIHSFEIPSIKSPMNLVMRGICSDLINLRYLLEFRRRASLGNYDINKASEYINSEIKVLTAEFIRSISQLDENQEEGLMTNYKTTYPYLFKNNRILTSKEIRPHDSDLIDLSHGNFMSEYQRYKFFKNEKEPYLDDLFIIFKYYCQFQHSTPFTQILIKNDLNFDYRNITQITNTFIAILINSALFPEDRLGPIGKKLEEIQRRLGS